MFNSIICCNYGCTVNSIISYAGQVKRFGQTANVVFSYYNVRKGVLVFNVSSFITTNMGKWS